MKHGHKLLGNAGFLAKHSKGAPLAKPMGPAPITVKHVMLLDTGDGAFVDESVKTKPHKHDPNKLVLKCTDFKRLASAVARLNLTLCAPIFKGKKHFIAVVWKSGFGAALLGQGGGASMLATQATSPVKKIGQPEVLTLTGKGGAK